MNNEVETNYLKRAEFLVELSRWREALNELNAYLSYLPSDYFALCHTARCHYELDELKTALEFSKKAIASEPELEWAYRLQSLIFRASGNNSKALEFAEICIQKTPFEILSLQTLAMAQIDKFLLADAKKTSEIMLEIAPESAATHDVCGYLALKNEDWLAAEKHYKLSLQIDPNSHVSLYNLGHIYLSRSKIRWNLYKSFKFYFKAIECFETSVKINPVFKPAQENLKYFRESGVIFQRPERKVLLHISLFVLYICTSLFVMYEYFQYFGMNSISFIIFIGIYFLLLIVIFNFISYKQNKNMEL